MKILRDLAMSKLLGAGSQAPVEGNTSSIFEKIVTFHDYDGTELYSYPIEELKKLTVLPEPPTHSGLTCKGWNWTLDELKEHDDSMNVGAVYVTDDDKNRYYLRLDTLEQNPISFIFGGLIKGNMTVEWGDGTEDSYEFSKSQQSVSCSHEYLEKGNYMIAISCTDLKGSYITFEGSMKNAIYKIELSKDVKFLSSCQHMFNLENIIGSICQISNYQLENCYCLQNFTFARKEEGDSNTASIGGMAFRNCYNIKNVSLSPNMESIGSRAFDSAKNLSKMYLPNSIKSIQTEAIQGLSLPLEYNDIPKGLRELAGNALKQVKIKTITIPSEMTTIPKSGFYNTQAEKVILHDNIVSIENNAFDTCNFSNFIIPESCNTLGRYVFQNCKFLKTISIPQGITSIPGNAFYGCTELKEVKMHNNITSIDSYAFSYCYRLKKIDLPDSIETIGPDVFQNCYSLETINLPSKIEVIPDRLFRNCCSLKHLTVNNKIKQIGTSAFEECGNLKSIDLSEVTEIPQYAFSKCYMLQDITFSDNLTSYGDYSFEQCRNLKSLIMPDTITSLGQSAFRQAGIEELQLSASLTNIPVYAFYETRIKKIKFPKSILNFGGYAFYSVSFEEADFSEYEQIPTIQSTTFLNAFFADNGPVIKVPASLYDSWKSATNWSQYAQFMVPVEV